MFSKKEIWKDIIGYEGLYQVSDLGNIKSLSRIKFVNGKYPIITKDKILKFKTDKDGYELVGLYKNGVESKKRVHRLVAVAFIPNPKNKPDVNHKNGIKKDNRASELEWCTKKENTNHAILLGLMNVNGEKNGQSKLKDNDINEIKLLSTKFKSSKLAIMYGVSKQSIENIINGKSWKHLQKK